MFRKFMEITRKWIPLPIRQLMFRIGLYFAPDSSRVFLPVNVEFGTTESIMYCLAQRGFNPKLAIDVGAYRGEWTQSLKKYYPACGVLMVEANEEFNSVLLACSKSLGESVTYQIALLGAKDGEIVPFCVMETGSSVYEERSPYQRVKVNKSTTTLDSLINTEDQVDFIKLDVQGYELEILRGGARCLNQAQVIQIEASLIPTNAGCPLISEVMAFMNDAGFQLFDFCTFLRRKDGALWQVDLIFLNKHSNMIPSVSLTQENWH